MAREQQTRSAILRPRRPGQTDSARVACLEPLCWAQGSAQGLVRFGKVDLAADLAAAWAADTRVGPEPPRQVRARSTPWEQDQGWECTVLTVFRISDIAEDISVLTQWLSRAACG